MWYMSIVLTDNENGPREETEGTNSRYETCQTQNMFYLKRICLCLVVCFCLTIL